MDFIYFLGRFHVLVLHLPIGIIVALFVLEWLARKEKYRYLEAASPFLWGATAITALVTVLFGYMHFAEGGFVGSSAYQHRTFGTALAVVATAIALLRASSFAVNYRPVFFPASILLLFLVTITGHYGGNLTHGSTYLVEYAPQLVRSLAGLAPRRPQITNLAEADPFADVVGPLFVDRCSTCHNADKQESGLDLTSYEMVMRGGESGRVVVPGNTELSELLRRITQDPDDEEFMPAEGKTPLTERQTEIIEWWITAGAPNETTIAEIALAPETQALLSAELGLEGGS
ncbi:MAG TPA: c-type cytochrome domain-containing protein [Gammaproteobacteria bacterium]|nr:c-type cytochrome domain-containing protein [Gammaproteobacteria bacterium]